MKTRYKIILIVVCAYFGIFFGPVAASNVYCDFVSQEMCTSRITGVVLPPLNLIIPSLPKDNCVVDNDEIMEPCYNDAGLLEWPFPPRMEVHPEIESNEICADVEKLLTCTSTRETYNVPPTCMNEFWPEYPNYVEEIKNKNNIPDQLRGVFGNCACQERVKSNPDTVERCPQPHISWENSTHYIDNNICEWREK